MAVAVIDPKKKRARLEADPMKSQIYGKERILRYCLLLAELEGCRAASSPSGALISKRDS